MTKAYSYIRFSTPEQSKGDSLRRQTVAAELYAKAHGLELDDALTFRDLGVSAFRGANEDTGRLGDFLEAVRHRDIVPGSYLLVESLDRISRKTPRKAVKVLESICDAGITVVTLADQRVYTEESLDDDPMAMMYAIMVAVRANEESATKSRRLKQAWEGKRLKADTKPLTAICPAWLKLKGDRSGYETISERATVVRNIFEWTLAGLGQHTIAAKLNGASIPTFRGGKVWHRSYVKKLLENAAVIGRCTPHTLDVIGGRKVRTPLQPVDGYYPAILDNEVFERVQVMSSRRSASRSATSYSTTAPMVANVLAGLAKCPMCGSTMTRVNKGARALKPHLVCTVAKAGAGCQYKQVRLEMIDYAVLSLGTYLHEKTPSPNEEAERKYRDAVIQADVVREQITNLIEGLAQGDTSLALRRALADREGLLVQLESELTVWGGLAADTMTNRIENTVGEFCAATQATEPDVEKINATLRQLFTRVIVDYRTGFLRMDWRHATSPLEVMYSMGQ